MYSVFWLGLTAFLLCFGLTPLCRNLGMRFDLLDHPDEVRKLHGRPIPRIGGVAIVLAYVGALAVAFVFPLSGKLYIQHHELLWSLLPATAIVFLTGLLDDLIGLKPWQKLVGQVIAASLAVGLGTRIHTTHSHFFQHHPLLATPWLSIPFSIAWLLACTNAVNLIDGLDGLAAGVGLFATITMLLVALFTGNTGLVLATMPLAGCLLAFLCFNFSPASIFLGDCGSLTIGFILGCFGLVWSQRAGTMLGLLAPLMTLALPLIDVGLSICRRYLRHTPIFKGDRGHIHHRILARGIRPRTAALILYGVCGVAASLAMLQSFSAPFLHALIPGVFVLLVWAGVHYLDYIELHAARRTLSSRRLLRGVRDEIYLHEIDHSLSQADTAEGCWRVVQKVCIDLQFEAAEMNLNHAHFSSDPQDTPLVSCWRITLPLGEDAYLTLCRSARAKPAEFTISTLEHLQRDLTEKQRIFSPIGIRSVSGPKHAFHLERSETSDAA